MLGELLEEARGKITGTRVLPDGKVETSFQGTSKLLGEEVTETATYWSALRPDGTLYGEGQAIIMSKAGDVATYKGAGVGRPTGRGLGVSFRGALYYETASPKWAKLSKVAAVYEFEADENGNLHRKAWEWK